jgi:hypothetical protein
VCVCVCIGEFALDNYHVLLPLLVQPPAFPTAEHFLHFPGTAFVQAFPVIYIYIYIYIYISHIYIYIYIYHIYIYIYIYIYIL